MNRPSIATWRPATTFILISGLVIILVSLVISYVVTNFKPTVAVRGGSAVYHLWLADTESERKQGLSGVQSLPPGGGLLMKFDEDNTHGIWMKDMLLPLDIVWLNKKKEVVYIVKNASPELSTDTVFAPKDPARYVIELAAGSAEKAALKKGTVMTFDENDQGGIW